MMAELSVKAVKYRYNQRLFNQKTEIMTPERNHRIRQLLTLRQPDLTVCIENVHKPHNLSAIVRTCDAVGVHQVHAVWKDQSEELRSDTAM